MLLGCASTVDEAATPQSPAAVGSKNKTPGAGIEEMKSQIKALKEQGKKELDKLPRGNDVRQYLNVRFGIHERCSWITADPKRSMLSDAVYTSPAFKKACPPDLKAREWLQCWDDQLPNFMTPDELKFYYESELSGKKAMISCIQKEVSSAANLAKAPDPTIKLDDANFEAETSTTKGTFVVDFYSDNCEPCKMIVPALTELAKREKGRLKVGRINVDENPKAANEITDSGGKMTLPMVRVYKDGVQIGEIRGTWPKIPMLDQIHKIIATD